MNNLSSVLLFIVEESVLDDFKTAAHSSQINYELVLQKVLVPFFQLEVRIVQEREFFKIGNLQFYVAAASFGRRW